MKVVKIKSNEVKYVVDLFTQYRQFYKQNSDPEKALEYLTYRLENNEAHIFVALCKEDDLSSAIGFTLLYPGYSSVSMETYWILNDLYVCKEKRKEGVAELLMKSAYDFCLETKKNKLVLETEETNKVAQNLYHKLGYVLETGMRKYSINVS